MTFNYDEFKQLVENFEDLYKSYNNFLEEFLIKQGNLLLARTKQTPRHPVKTGYLIGKWFMYSPRHIGNKHYVGVRNNTKYASWVEDGHRTVNGGWVKGKHMALMALTEVDSQLNIRFQTAFKKWLKSKGL